MANELSRYMIADRGGLPVEAAFGRELLARAINFGAFELFDQVGWCPELAAARIADIAVNAGSKLSLLHDADQLRRRPNRKKRALGSSSTGLV